MTKQELIDAFVGGTIGRRDFVRRLTALGVSTGAALAYAQTLAPSAAAAGGGPRPSGFVMRAQADEGEYGTACTIPSDSGGVEALLAAEQQVAAILDSLLGSFDETDFSGISVLEGLSSVVADQTDALGTLLGDLGGSAPAAPSGETFSSVDDGLAALADALNSAVGLFVGVIPAVQNGEARQTLTTISTVLARYAGVVSTLVGDGPAAGAFDEPVCP